MLFTLDQMNAYVDYALAHYQAKDRDGNQAGATHGLRMHWQQEQDITPIRAGQQLTLQCQDGVELNLEVTDVRKDGLIIND